ncbi:MAG TPA: hypothetical protein DET40_04780 [Lentisphaeria bacterium]|nr:hypothetical protein [Lentisphaeria bacterium]
MVLLAGGFLAYQAFPDVSAPQAQDAIKKKSTRPMLEPKGVPPSNPPAAVENQPKTLVETPYLLKELDSNTLFYKYGPIEATLKKGKEYNGHCVITAVTFVTLPPADVLNSVDEFKDLVPARSHAVSFLDIESFNKLTNNGKGCMIPAREKATPICVLAASAKVIDNIKSGGEIEEMELKGYYATVTGATFKGKPVVIGNAADAQSKKNSKPETRLIITELNLVPAKK